MISTEGKDAEKGKICTMTTPSLQLPTTTTPLPPSPQFSPPPLPQIPQLTQPHSRTLPLPQILTPQPLNQPLSQIPSPQPTKTTTLQPSRNPPLSRIPPPPSPPQILPSSLIRHRRLFRPCPNSALVANSAWHRTFQHRVEFPFYVYCAVSVQRHRRTVIHITGPVCDLSRSDTKGYRDTHFFVDMTPQQSGTSLETAHISLHRRKRRMHRKIITEFPLIIHLQIQLQQGIDDYRLTVL